MWQMDVPLSLVTVMIGSILVGGDFSIHIANRIRELGGGIGDRFSCSRNRNVAV